jgi:hypothetical protein
MARAASEEQKERRKNASRRNGARSRGPTTSAGKFNSSRSRLSHACYAKVHALRDENPAVVNRDRQRWFDLKKPKTIEQEVLVEECFRGQLMQQRFHRARDRALIRQQEDGIAQWEDEQDEWLAELKDELVMGRQRTVAEIMDELRTFGAGVRYLIGELEGLGRALEGPGFWDRQQVWTAVRILRCSPGPATVAEDPDVYHLALCNFLCMPEPPQAEIERMLEPVNRPAELRETPRAALVVPAAEARAELKEWVEKSLEELRLTEEKVVNEVDIPALQAMCDEAAVINDPAEARKFHRLGGEYRTTLYKSLNLLHSLQKKQGQGTEPPPPGNPESREHSRAAAARQRVRRPTADIKTSTTAGESENGPEKAGNPVTEVCGGQQAEGFPTGVSGESRLEPSREGGAAAGAPSGAAATGPTGDGPVLRQDEVPPAPRVSTAYGSAGTSPFAERDSEAHWWVPSHRLRQGGPASRTDPDAAGPTPGRPPPGAG